jgi:septum formation protein
MVHTLRQFKLILASSSPRRKQLLAEAGVDAEVIVPPIAEPTGLMSMAPRQQAEALAYFKAKAVAQTHPDEVVLGADTIVACSNAVIGKPTDEDDARRMLQMLSGTRHMVITGVALLGPGYRKIYSDLTWLKMRKITSDEVEGYIRSGEWIGKAGAYAIQETADRFVESIDGSFSNVVGLPMELVGRLIEDARTRIESDNEC